MIYLISLNEQLNACLKSPIITWLMSELLLAYLSWFWKWVNTFRFHLIPISQCSQIQRKVYRNVQNLKWTIFPIRNLHEAYIYFKNANLLQSADEIIIMISKSIVIVFCCDLSSRDKTMKFLIPREPKSC